jgi:hypothetical protein
MLVDIRLMISEVNFKRRRVTAVMTIFEEIAVFFKNKASPLETILLGVPTYIATKIAPERGN